MYDLIYKEMTDNYLASPSNKRAKAVLDELLTNGKIDDWGFTDTEVDRFLAYDGWFVLPNGNKYLFETKNINYPHDKFKGGWMLEVDKRKEVLKAAKKMDCKGAVYINTFSDGLYAMWNIGGTMDKPIGTISAPACSYEALGTREKKVVYLKWDERINKNSNGK